MNQKLVIGITGASGVLFGIRLLETCWRLKVETHLVLSEWGEKNIEIETDYSLGYLKQLCNYNHDINDLAAPISSGSFKHNGMVVLPCSIKTLGALANGYTANLIIRAADVTLKEGRNLLLAPRETPFHSIHLENMLKLSRMGAVIFPPVPSMYNRPENINDLINHTVGRILDRMGISNELYSQWDGPVET